MSNEVQVKKLTDIMAQFVGFTAKKLPDDVIAKLQELRDQEDSPMAKVIYDVPQSGAGAEAEPSFLSGYRRVAVLGKMRYKVSVD